MIDAPALTCEMSKVPAPTRVTEAALAIEPSHLQGERGAGVDLRALV